MAALAPMARLSTGLPRSCAAGASGRADHAKSGPEPELLWGSACSWLNGCAVELSGVGAGLSRRGWGGSASPGLTLEPTFEPTFGSTCEPTCGSTCGWAARLAAASGCASAAWPAASASRSVSGLELGCEAAFRVAWVASRSRLSLRLLAGTRLVRTGLGARACGSASWSSMAGKGGTSAPESVDGWARSMHAGAPEDSRTGSGVDEGLAIGCAAEGGKASTAGCSGWVMMQAGRWGCRAAAGPIGGTASGEADQSASMHTALVGDAYARPVGTVAPAGSADPA